MVVQLEFMSDTLKQGILQILLAQWFEVLTIRQKFWIRIPLSPLSSFFLSIFCCVIHVALGHWRCLLSIRCSLIFSNPTGLSPSGASVYLLYSFSFFLPISSIYSDHPFPRLPLLLCPYIFVSIVLLTNQVLPTFAIFIM